MSFIIYLFTLLYTISLYETTSCMNQGPEVGLAAPYERDLSTIQKLESPPQGNTPFMISCNTNKTTSLYVKSMYYQISNSTQKMNNLKLVCSDNTFRKLFEYDADIQGFALPNGVNSAVIFYDIDQVKGFGIANVAPQVKSAPHYDYVAMGNNTAQYKHIFGFNGLNPAVISGVVGTVQSNSYMEGTYFTSIAFLYCDFQPS